MAFPRRLIQLCACLLLLPATRLEGQEAAPGGARSVKRARAVRVPQGAIRLDGALDEEVWRAVPAITDFIQAEPVEGAAPSEGLEVRFAYDEDALYVGARMYSRDPGAIQAPLGRRDANGEQAEYFLISLDTFLDRRTAYTFGVSASGVRIDRYHAADEQSGADAGFNPVWEARTHVDARGWTAELWIPFSQLRFNKQAAQVWGLNVRRFIPTLQEQVDWVLIPRTERAWASRFGELVGVDEVRPGRRIELLPVAVGSSMLTPDRDPANPFDDGRNLSSRVGGDLKMGLGPNLTLDATINPDFGQVEADPAEVNLTAFATRFPEKRPFFTEGAGLLSLNHNNVFYSRRIGRAPTGPAAGDYVDYPETSTILGAAKVTGRLPGGTSLGILTAVTGEESARVWDVGDPRIREVRVAPRTTYGVARVQHELGRSGSTASVMVGAAHRDLPAADALADLLARSALVYGGDAVLRFRGGEYELRTAAVGTYVGGEMRALERLQRSSSHFMQRPDRTYAVLDPTRTSLGGFSTLTTFDRVSGRHWLFGLRAKLDTPEFETNDIGNLNGADGIEPTLNVTYRETRPGRVFRSYAIRLTQANEWNFGGDRQRGTVQSTVNATWANFWNSSVSLTRNFRTRDSDLARGGPLIGGPRGWTATLEAGNRASSPTRWSLALSTTDNELGGKVRSAASTVSVRPGPRWELSATPSYNRTVEAQQYVATLGGGRPETFGSRYVLAYIDRSTFSAQLRTAFTLMPDLNLDVYAEPFAASGRYYDYGELLAPASLERLTYGSAAGTAVEPQPDGSRIVSAGQSRFRLPNADFNVRSFRSNIVLRWEWRPGSTMFLVWQQNRESRQAIGTRVGLTDVFGSLTEPGTNILLFKTSFWIPVR